MLASTSLEQPTCLLWLVVVPHYWASPGRLRIAVQPVLVLVLELVLEWVLELVPALELELGQVPPAVALSMLALSQPRCGAASCLDPIRLFLSKKVLNIALTM